MRQLAVLIVMCGCLLQEASAQTFNRRYDAWGQLQTEGALGVEVLPEGYIVFIGSAYSDGQLQWSSVVTSMQLSSAGDVLLVDGSIDPIMATYPGFVNPSFPLAQGGFGLGGSTFDVAPNGDWIQRPALFLFDAQGNVEGFTEYGPEGQEWIGRQGKQTPDGGYVICGETSAVGILNGFVLKIAANGEQEWVRTYGLANRREYLVTIDVTPDGGYYLGGEQQITSAQIYSPWVLRLDAAGEVLWQNTYGTQWDDGPNAHVTTAADGKCLFTGGLAVDDTPIYRPYVGKLDSSGGLLWRQFYGEAIFSSTFFVVQEVSPGGDLIAVGQHYVDNLQTVGYEHGVLLRTNPVGDSLWMRFYDYYDDQVSNGRGVLYDVQPTPDDGFVAVGMALAVQGPQGVISQDAWVIKVDQHGCLVPGCQVLDGMDTQYTNLREALQLCPNPVAEQLTLRWALPQGLRTGSAQLTVVNSLGQIVATEGLRLHEEQMQLDVQHLAPGLYHLHLVQDGKWLAGGSFVRD